MRRIRPSRRRKSGCGLWCRSVAGGFLFEPAKAPPLRGGSPIGQGRCHASRETKKNGALGICLGRYLIQDAEAGEWVFSAQAGQLVSTRRACACCDGKVGRSKIAAHEVDTKFGQFYSPTLGKKIALFLQFLEAWFRRLRHFFGIANRKTVAFQNGAFPRTKVRVGTGDFCCQSGKAGSFNNQCLDALAEFGEAHRRIFRRKSARTGKEMRPASYAGEAIRNRTSPK